MSETDELAITEAEELTGYSGRHIRRLVQQGRVKGRRPGGWLYLVDRESLLDYVSKMDRLGNEKHDPNV